MAFVKAFAVGGLICVIGQILIDVFKLTPAHTLCSLVVAGALLSAFNIYPILVDFAGAGATTPISSFGNSLLTGACEGARENGFWGLFSGLYKSASSGIAAAVVFAFAAAVFFRPKG
ncbi:MAG: stage V sporulation protein AE [Clostridiales bacterium]|nr:stage V sporulation protein AE [Clostridiales bacterium]